MPLLFVLSINMFSHDVTHFLKCCYTFPAKEFFGKFSVNQEDYYQEDLKKLSTVTKQEHMKGNQLMENFK